MSTLTQSWFYLMPTPPPPKSYKRHFENLGDLNMDQLITRHHWRITINFVWYDSSNVVMQKNIFRRYLMKFLGVKLS